MRDTTQLLERPHPDPWPEAATGSEAPAAGLPVATLAVRRLRLSDFRGYARTELAVGPRPVVLSGPNGAGKTNLLEALSFLVPGRGLRGVRLGEIARAETEAEEDGAGWAVAARLDTPRGPVEIGTGLAGMGSGTAERRLVRIDGAPARPAALAEHVSMVWLTPAMDRLFVEAASERRRFLDRLVLSQDADHASRLAAYDKAMRDRGRLLREGPWDTAWLGALESAMGEQGIAIAAARRTAVARLNGALATAEEDLFPQVALSVEDETGAWLDAQPAVEAEDRFRAALAAARRRDAEAGRALTGPHRADLRALYVAKGRDAARCSTGEQKAMLIAVLLASARLQAAESAVTPILLLDEVAAHLDAARRVALFDAVCALGAQAWFTGTDPALFAALAGRAQHFHVADATITAA